MICKLELSTIEKKNSDWSKFVPNLRKNHNQTITSKVHFEIIILCMYLFYTKLNACNKIPISLYGNKKEIFTF